MKFILPLVLVLVSSLSFGQRKLMYQGDQFGASNSGIWIQKNPEKENEIEGSYFLFKHNWFTGLITVDNGKQYEVANLNYNAKYDQLEAAFSNDSVFVFNSANIEKVVIGDKVLTTHLDPVKSRISYYEFIEGIEGMEILKQYRVHVVRGGSNPMTQKQLTPDRYEMTADYFLAEGEKLSEIKLRKKYLLKLFKEDSDKIKEYVSENDLSYKDEEDVKQIIDYYRKMDRTDS